MGYTIGIDLGGTKIAVGLVDESYRLIDKMDIPTALPRSASELEADTVNLCSLLLKRNGVGFQSIRWAGIGTPGWVDVKAGIVGYNANFSYHDWHLRDDMKARLQCDVYIENDANAAAWGEYMAGALKGASLGIAVTLGTGIGGGVVMDGKLFSGSNSAGGEFGHMVTVENGKPCMCGRNGCFEKYASARALIEQTQDAMRENRDTVLWELVEGDIKKVNAKTSFDGMRRGDATARRIVKAFQKHVACGLVNIINIFQPDILCIGGGMSKEGEVLLAPIRDYVQCEDFARNHSRRVYIVPAELENDAGIIGAAMLGSSGLNQPGVLSS